jgi:hypothetical protein
MSAFANPVIVRNGSGPVVLQRVPLTGPDLGTGYSEAWLQDLLFRVPQALPIAEIDDGFAGMVPVCRELNTSVGPIDVVYVTPSGRPVIVEAKLWRNPESRRKVVGQILDYAKELSHWTYETFDAAVRAARRAEDGGQSPKGLLDVIRARAPELDEARFFDSVSQSLRRGDLLLLIVGDGIREGVGAIAQFLETHATLHFTFGLVEMAVHDMPDGGHLVQPRVLAQSTIIRRVVVQLDGAGLKAQDEPQADVASEEAVSDELIQTRQRFTEFWSEFLAQLQLDDKSQPVGKPGKSTNQYFYMPPGSNGWISAYLAQSNQAVGVYLTFSRGALADRIYAGLSADRDEIDKALGVPVAWTSDGAKHYVSARESFLGSLLDERRNEIITWLADRVNRFVTVFRPRIEKLLKEID